MSDKEFEMYGILSLVATENKKDSSFPTKLAPWVSAEVDRVLYSNRERALNKERYLNLRKKDNYQCLE